MLRDWRVERGLTQIQFATQLGVAQSDISNIERGVGRPGLAWAVRIQKLTGIEPAAWIKGTAA